MCENFSFLEDFRFNFQIIVVSSILRIICICVEYYLCRTGPLPWFGGPCAETGLLEIGLLMVGISRKITYR